MIMAGMWHTGCKFNQNQPIQTDGVFFFFFIDRYVNCQIQFEIDLNLT